MTPLANYCLRRSSSGDVVDRKTREVIIRTWFCFGGEQTDSKEANKGGII
jgi:hypothetical protein